MDGRQVLVGTCGYSYAEWQGVFYPNDLRQKDFLKFYSLVFPFVELDFSWYAMPRASTLEAMAEQTNPDFRFALKVHKSLTHEVTEEWPERAEEFTKAATVLADAAKLSAVLIQLPYSFSYTAEHRTYLADLCSALGSLPLVVEFRNDAWYLPRVYEELEKRKIALAILDRPDIEGLPPETAIVTSDLVYYRLHGRNAGEWWKGDATSRYDYDYSPRELDERAHRIVALSKKASRVLVAFNNHAGGNAARNAKALISLIRELLV